MTPIQTNKPVFFNSSGEPLNGTIYIGQPDADPRTSPKTVTFRDSGGSTFTASQPLTTINGRITYNGKPIVALVDGEYSMLVFDSAGVQVDYSRSVNDGGTTGGGIGDFSEVTRVGLTLSEVKAFDVAVGEVVRSIGKVSATDNLGADWLVISATGGSGDDIDLIDFVNGLQGSRIKNVVYRAVQQISLSGSDYTLTAADQDYRIFELAGTLTASVNVIVPDSQAVYTIINNTSGSFSVTAKTSTGTGVDIPQGQSRIVRSDGTDVIDAAGFVDFPVMPQVGGDPIVESGSNADGEWTRWAEGTQICRLDALATVTSLSHNNGYAGGFRSGGGGAGAWTYPAAFIAVPSHNAHARPDSLLINGLPGAQTASDVNFTSWRVSTGSADVTVKNLFAFGRWK